MATRPTRAGPYRLLDQLGHGGMGVVYRAEHLETGAVVAVKTIRALEGPLLSSFRREVGALSRIHHPGVVRIHEHGVDDGVPWMAMELVEGTSLRERILANRYGAGLEDALRILQRLCTALAVVHGEGIVHRDLKPQNVIVRPDGSPVLIDFGVVGRFAGLANREAVDLGEEGAGTIAYMAPEQIQGEPVDARADLYALGLVAYRALAGRPAFVGDDAIAIATAARTAGPPDPKLWVMLSRDLERVLRLGLAARAEDRFATAAELKKAFESAFAGTLDERHRLRADRLLDREPWSRPRAMTGDDTERPTQRSLTPTRVSTR